MAFFGFPSARSLLKVVRHQCFKQPPLFLFPEGGQGMVFEAAFIRAQNPASGISEQICSTGSLSRLLRDNSDHKMGAAAFVILYIVLGRPVQYQMLVTHSRFVNCHVPASLCKCCMGGAGRTQSSRNKGQRAPNLSSCQSDGHIVCVLAIFVRMPGEVRTYSLSRGKWQRLRSVKCSE